MKKGLVMEGGAMRGLFTAGVIDVLMENDIKFDGGAGVSAGACFGCNYKSRQNGRAIRYNLRFSKEKRYCSFYSLLTTGDIFGAEFCYHEVPDELDIFDKKVFEENPMEFFTVSTDVLTGKPIYHRMKRADYNELEWLRGSASMPLFSRIVEVDGRKLLDGGVSDSIPLKFMNGIGYEKNVVILTRPRDYTKNQSSMLPLIKLKYRKYPEFVKTYEKRHKMYNAQLEYIRKSEESGKTFVIAPPENLPIGRIEHEQENMLEVYRTGRLTATKYLYDIIEFLNCDTL